MSEVESVRIDWVMTHHEFDEETGIAKISLVPNPQRYSWEEVDEERMLYDELDECFYPTSGR